MDARPPQPPSTQGRAWLTAAVLLAGLGTARPATAFQQATTANGCGTRWHGADPKSAVGKLAYTLGDKPPQGISAGIFAAAVDLAFDAWAAVPCSLCASARTGCAPEACPAHPLGITFAALGPATPGPSGTRCPEPAPGCGSFVQAVQAPDPWPFGKAVIAQTLVVRNTFDGTIVDADILLNDVDLDFCLAPCAPGKHDLQGALTHEVGHFLGLDHSEEAAARMAPYVGQGPKDPVALHADDRLGICTAYRTVCAPACADATCCLPGGQVVQPVTPAPAPGDGGCGAGRGRGGNWLVVLVLFGATWIARQRRYS